MRPTGMEACGSGLPRSQAELAIVQRQTNKRRSLSVTLPLSSAVRKSRPHSQCAPLQKPSAAPSTSFQAHLGHPSLTPSGYLSWRAKK